MLLAWTLPEFVLKSDPGEIWSGGGNNKLGSPSAHLSLVILLASVFLRDWKPSTSQITETCLVEMFRLFTSVCPL